MRKLKGGSNTVEIARVVVVILSLLQNIDASRRFNGLEGFRRVIFPLQLEIVHSILYQRVILEMDE